MKEKFRRFMLGRYGADALNKFLLVLALLLIIIGYIVGNIVGNAALSLLVWLLLIAALFRSLSRNISRRQRENMVYWRCRERVLGWLGRFRRRHADKEHHYLFCPRCHTRLRVPKGRGKIRITCTRCGYEFEKKS